MYNAQNFFFFPFFGEEGRVKTESRIATRKIYLSAGKLKRKLFCTNPVYTKCF